MSASALSRPTHALQELHADMELGSNLDVRAPQPKKVVVVGAGTQGITTAYWLGRAGHAVTVVDRASSDSLGSSGSFTGLMQINSAFAPVLARPSLFRAYKVTWCPYTDYMHPILRVGLFDSEVGQRVRVALTPYSTREQYIPSITKLQGLALWNTWLMKKLMAEWNTPSNAKSLSTAPAAASGAGAITPIVRSSMALVFDDRAWKDVRMDLDTMLHLSDPNAPPAGKWSAAPRVTTSDAAPQRMEQLSDQACVARIPQLKPREFNLAGGIVFEDELAVDNIAVLKKFKKDSVEKFGVKFIYDTEVLKFNAPVNATGSAVPATTAAAPSTTAVVPAASASVISSAIPSIQTSKGSISGDAFVLCAGSESKRLVRESQLAQVPMPILTFTTKTHHLSFPYPKDTTASTNTAVTPGSSSSAIPPVSVLLLESHTVITPLPNEIRVSSGDEINPLEDMLLTSAPAAGTKLSPAPRLDPARLKQLVDDVSGVYPSLTREVISQNGATIPHVSLRTWTLDNKPLLGRYHPALSNLYINNAHGPLGWSHALAAGKHTADIISGTPTFIDAAPFDPKRFSQPK